MLKWVTSRGRFWALLGFYMTALAGFSAAGSASKCEDIDVRKSMTPALAHLFSNPLDQQSAGWCYAFSVADLLTQATGRPISPEILAFSYNARRSEDQNDDSLSGGQASVLLNLTLKQTSVCEAGIFPNTWTALKDESSLDGTFAQILQKAGQKSGSTFRGNLKELAASLVKRYLLPLNEKQMEEFIEAHLEEKPLKVIYDFSVMRCQHPIKPTQLPYTASDIHFHHGKFLFNKKVYSGDLKNVDAALDHYKLASIAYELAPLLIFKNSDPKYLLEYSSHASVILARKQKSDDCYYYVRNSWGHTCETGPVRFNPSQVSCDPSEGGFWISRKNLNKVLTDSVWVGKE